MAYRIQRSEKGGAVVFALSGEIGNEQTERLRDLLEQDKYRTIVVDLANVTVVGRAGVQFLAQIEAAGVRIVNCPGYVRRWIFAEGQSQ